MVQGIDRFAQHFSAHSDRYMLIGGAATWLVLDEAGLEARVSKDLDIVLAFEALDAEFGRVFWDFVQSGGYKVAQKRDGKPSFYRFYKPEQGGYPVMLELFSRNDENLTLPENANCMPIPLDDDVSSLSAILLDDTYYDFIRSRTRLLNGLSVVSETGLIILKARAWLDLTARKEAGQSVDSRNIKKHLADVVRLQQLLPGTERVDLPEQIRADFAAFLGQARSAVDAGFLKNIHIRGTSPEALVEGLERVYLHLDAGSYS